MKIKIVFLLLILTPLMGFSDLHKYYFSTTEVNYDRETHAFQITSNIFYDDFEAVLKERYDENFNFESTSKEKTNTYIKRYYTQKFVIQINGEQKEVSFLGYKTDGEYITSYLEIKDIAVVKTFSLENTLLLDLFKEQKNIVHLKVADYKKSFLLNESDTKVVLNFEE